MIFGMAIASKQLCTPLVRLDFDKGTAHRYQARRPGGKPVRTAVGAITDNGALWGTDEGLALIEKFRLTGNV